MDAIVQFFTALVVAMAATALAHFGMVAEGLELRGPKPAAERAIKRSPAPEAPPARSKTRACIPQAMSTTQLS